MTLLTCCLGRLGALLVGLSLWTGSRRCLAPGTPLRRLWSRREDGWRQELAYLRSPLRASHVLGAQALGLTAGFGCALLGHGALGAVLIAAALLAPTWLLRRARLRRSYRIEQQLEGWLGAVINCLQSTPSLGEAIRGTESLVDRPLRDEIGRILAEQQLGTPLDRALEHSAQRVQSRLYSTVLLTLRVGRSTGGDLPELLAVTARDLREMARLEGVVRTKTAEGKAQATVISAIPFPLVLGIRQLSPGFFDPLAATTLGHCVVGLATLLWLAAVLLARRILAVDVT